MTEGHEVSPGAGFDHRARRILAEVEAGRGVSQRALAQHMGIALGLTNLLLRRLIRKGWIRISRVKRNRVMYLLTPAGIAEKARMTQTYFASSMRFYGETRQRVRERFAALEAEWEGADDAKTIAFFGASEVAEIGYVCLQETSLRLVEVFDDVRTNAFFGIPVRPSSALCTPEPRAFRRLVVMSFGDAEAIHARLEQLGVPPDLVFWI